MSIDYDKLGYYEMSGDLARATKDAIYFGERLAEQVPADGKFCTAESRRQAAIRIKIGASELRFNAGENDNETPVIRDLIKVVNEYVKALDKEQTELQKLIAE